MMKHCSAYSGRLEGAVTLSEIISVAIYQHFFLILAPLLPDLCSHLFREGRRIEILKAEELCLFSPSLILSNITSTCLVSSISLLSGPLIYFYLPNFTSQVLSHPTHIQMVSEPKRSKITYSMSSRRFGVRIHLGPPNLAFDECLFLPG